MGWQSALSCLLYSPCGFCRGFAALHPCLCSVAPSGLVAICKRVMVGAATPSGSFLYLPIAIRGCSLRSYSRLLSVDASGFGHEGGIMRAASPKGATDYRQGCNPCYAVSPTNQPRWGGRALCRPFGQEYHPCLCSAVPLARGYTPVCVLSPLLGYPISGCLCRGSAALHPCLCSVAPSGAGPNSQTPKLPNSQLPTIQTPNLPKSKCICPFKPFHSPLNPFTLLYPLPLPFMMRAV